MIKKKISRYGREGYRSRPEHGRSGRFSDKRIPFLHTEAKGKGVLIEGDTEKDIAKNLLIGLKGKHVI